MFNTNIVRAENRELHNRQSQKERALLMEHFAGLFKLVDEEIGAASEWDEDTHCIEVYHLLLTFANIR